MTFSSLGDPWNGGRLEFKAMYMKKLPLPQFKGEVQDEITAIVKEIESGKTGAQAEDKLNELIYKLYDLTDEEIKIVEGRT